MSDGVGITRARVAAAVALGLAVVVRPRLVVGFVVLFVGFGVLERATSLHRQRVFRQGWGTDVVHFFATKLAADVVFIAAVIPVFLWLRHAGGGPVSAQPLWAQFIEGHVIGELAFYWAHRATHQVRRLWRLHAVHHSIREMDWLASARQHPLDAAFVRLCTVVPLALLGFSKSAFAALLLFQGLLALFIHANTRLRFGPLRWVITTPEFHHWHHADEPGALNKNFAGGLPVLDVLFGTAFMPKGEYPSAMGCPDPVPGFGYVRQLAWPFTSG